MFKYTEFVTHSVQNMGKEVYDAYGTEKIEESITHIESSKLADHGFILRVMGHLLGKVLTTVEATTSSEAQAKAIKDLMRQHFSTEMDFVASMMFDQAKLNDAAEQAMQGVEDEEIVSVEIDEILGVK